MRAWLAGFVMCLAVTAAGVLLVRGARGGQSQAEMVARWNRTNGALIEIKILDIPLIKTPDRYRAQARYTFDVEGRRYTGTGIFERSTAATIDALKRELGAWLSDPAARVSDTPDSLGVVYTYAPFAETVPV